MKNKGLYSTKLGAGLGLINETKVLLGLWEPGMNTQQLQKLALKTGVLPHISARRLLNIIAEGFAYRYLVNNRKPAQSLKILAPVLNAVEFQQLLLLFTCRANLILSDFIKQIYWERYASGSVELTTEDARRFIERALDDGLMEKRWSPSVVKRVSSYLIGCCADYGLLENSRSSHRKILPFQIYPKTAIFLAYDLHFQGIGDNALVEHEDWKLFGQNREDVIGEFKRLSLTDVFIIQSAAGFIKLSWKYKNMEEVCDVLTQN